jgi:hypothetical protein
MNGVLHHTKIAGIPCTVNVTRCVRVKGSFSYNAPSDWDYYGYSEVEYDVCDRRGRRADWLAKKLTPTEDERIKGEILEAMSESNNDYDYYDY